MLTIASKLLKPQTAANKKIVVHLEIGHTPLPVSTQKVKGKNIAFALDVSGSMDESIKRVDYASLIRNAQPQPAPAPVSPMWPKIPAPHVPFNPWAPLNPPNPHAPHLDPQQPFFLGHIDPQNMIAPAPARPVPVPVAERITKIMLAKKALKAATEVMGEDDTVSIILFNGHAQALVRTVAMTAQNKANILEKIDGVLAQGGTNLHLGWLDAMGCVSEKFDKTKINRVMVLSDGQTNQGVQDTDKICAQVASFLDKGISTTTFGIGEDFNELLLQGMSEAGGGDFHFIDNDKSFEELFSQELNNVSATVASNMVLGMAAYKHIKSAVNLQEFTQKPNGYLLPNLIRNKKVHATIEIEHDAQEGENVEVPFVISYLDMQGVEQTMTHNLVVSCVSETEEAKLEDNKEVMVHIFKIQTAKTTKEAGLFAANGARPQAKEALMAQINALTNFDKEAMKHEITSLQNALYTCEDLSVSNSFSAKMLRSQSYDTRYGKF